MSPSPRPSRRTRAPILWSRRAATGIILLLTAILLAVTLIWGLAGDRVARETAGLLNRLVMPDDSRLTLGEFGGFPLVSATVAGARLETLADQEWFPFLEADRVRVDYDLWGVLHGRYVASRVEIHGGRLQLRARPDGGFRLPGSSGPREEGAEGSGGGLPDFLARRVILHDTRLQLDLPWRTLPIDSVDAELEVFSRNGDLQLTVHRLTGVLPDSLGRIEIDRGTLRVEDEVLLEDIRGRLGGSPFFVNGTPSGDAFRLDAELGDFPLVAVTRLFELDADLTPGYADTVSATLTRDDGVRFDWQLEGRWDVWDVQEAGGRAHIHDGRLDLTGVDLLSRGTRVRGGRVEIPFAAPTLRVEADFTGLDTRKIPIEAISAIEGEFSGHAVVRLDERGEALDGGGNASVDLDAGHVYEIPFLSGLVSVRGDGTTWKVDTLHVEMGEATLRGIGTIGERTYDLAFLYLGDLKPWRQFVRQESLSGSGTLNVTLAGWLDRPVLEVRGSLFDFAVGPITAPRLDLERASGTVLAERDFRLEFGAPLGVGIAGVPFSHATGQVNVTEDRVRMEDLTLAQGDTTISLAGVMAWEPHLILDLNRAEARLLGRTYRLGRPGRLELDDGLLTGHQMTIVTPRGDFGFHGDWNLDTQEVAATLTLDDLDPSVFFPQDDPPFLRIGAISGIVDLVGIAPDLEGRANVAAKAIEWDRGRLDSLRVIAETQGRDITLTRLAAKLEDGGARLAGRIRMQSSLYRTLEDWAVGPGIDPERTEWDVHGEVDNLNLLRWLTFLPRTERPAGRIDADVRVAGTSAAPLVDLDLAARRLVWRSLSADSLRTRLHVEEGTGTISALRLWQGGRPLDVRGTFPVDLVLYPFRWHLPERPLDLDIHTEEGDLASLRITPWVADASGALRADLRMYGTPQRPYLQGEVLVSDGTIRPTERDEVVENIAATLRFQGDLVEIVEAHGELEGGTVEARGTYRFYAGDIETYELTLHADRAVVREEGTYAARVSGDLVLEPRRGTDGNIYPYAHGDVFVHRAEYAGALEPQDIGRFEPPAFLYEVNIDAPERVLIRTEEVDAELGGELLARQQVAGRTIVGEMVILRGKYQFFRKSFDVLDGTLIWNRPLTLLPELDITVETKEPPYLIRAELTGRADEPVIVFSAQSLDTGASLDLPQEDIVRILAVGAVGLSPEALGLVDGGTSDNESGPNTQDRVLVSATSLFTDQLERTLLRDMGMSELVDEIIIGTSSDRGEFVPSVGLRKWVTSEISIQYIQRLSRGFDQDLALEYRLRRKLFLRGEMLRRRESGETGTQTYNLDLRLRHEY